jgi:hypothetical protein
MFSSNPRIKLMKNLISYYKISGMHCSDKPFAFTICEKCLAKAFV